MKIEKIARAADSLDATQATHKKGKRCRHIEVVAVLYKGKMRWVWAGCGVGCVRGAAVGRDRMGWVGVRWASG